LSRPFRLLLIADTHYDPTCEVAGDAPDRHVGLGRELAGRAIEDARNRGGFDAVALLGDVINKGTEPHAGAAIEGVFATIASASDGAPLLAVPGNHDYDGDELPGAVEWTRGVREIGGYRFVCFADTYVDTKYGTRSDADRRFLRKLAGREGGPIVAVQHNPFCPLIEADYPYMLTNRDEVVSDYAQAGVMLSISGHYHAGQELNRNGGVLYYTAPAISEPPFSYAMVELRGSDVSVERRPLAVEGAPLLVDCHAHTEFAYCSRGLTATELLRRSRLFGLAGQCLVEHAGQLYVSEEDFWAGRTIHEPQLWRSAPQRRMDAFREAMAPLRGAGVRIGMEVELDRDGHLTLLDEDRDFVDLLVGAVHWLVEDAPGLADGELARAFMRNTEGLLEAGVDVLAHPFRLFRRIGRDVSTELYNPVADALAASGAAAEINFHCNSPEEEFFAACIDRGVKISFATDAHELHEAGALGPHLALLRRAAGQQDVSGLLYYPPAPDRS